MIPAIEIAVQDTTGAQRALDAGASRIELCHALELGGLTPSIGAVEGAVSLAREAGVPGAVQVLIRPRPGGFVYSAAELRTMLADIRAARAAGAAGVVIGVLREDRNIDIAATRACIEAAEGMAVTFHRAVDLVPDPLVALDELRSLGITRVLTGGQAARAAQGAPMLAELVAHAEGGIEIMAGGSVRVEEVAALRETGVSAIHLSARVRAASEAPAAPGASSSDYEVTSEELVRAAVAAAAGATPPHGSDEPSA